MASRILTTALALIFALVIVTDVYAGSIMSGNSSLNE